VQFDEKWSFVAKKEKHCDRGDEADDWCGDCWDHVAFDPEHRLAVSAVVGKHSAEHIDLLVDDSHRRTEGRLMDLMTSDEDPAYAEAILACYGEEYQPRRKGRRGRKPARRERPPPGLNYATVHKTRVKDRVVKAEQRVIHGAPRAVAAARAGSAVSEAVDTAFVERQNGTDRNRNARKVRETYRFSKDGAVHEAVSYFTLYGYNFCWPVRTPRQGSRRKGYRQRTPAMAAGLADHVWTPQEWLSFPAAQPS
jgi:hypothetical protein